MPAGTITGVVTARSGITLLARIRGSNGRLITQATLTSIAYAVYNLTLGTTAGTGTFVIADVVFNSLQQDDPRWTRDGPWNLGSDKSWGYNFAATVPATLFATTTLAAEENLAAAHRFQVEVTFTPTAGEPFRQLWQFRPEQVFGA